MAIPPSKTHLQALAGWAISASHHGISDQQHVALSKFKDGCVGLSEVVDALPVLKQATSAPVAPAREEPPVEQPIIPPEVRKNLGVKEGDECHHRFDIRTQRCQYCGISYLKAHGRKPELF